jgi:hypothetical protein
MAWFGKIFEPYRLFDGALSLNLCLATNLLAVELESSSMYPLTITLEVLNLIDWTSVRKSNHAPFQKVEKMFISSTEPAHNSYAARITPRLGELWIDNNAALSHFHYPSVPGNPALHNLVMDDINFNPKQLETLIESGWLCSLDCLRINGAGFGGMNAPDERESFNLWNYNYTHLKDVMAKHLPLFGHSFGWERRSSSQGTHSFHLGHSLPLNWKN